MASKRSLRWVYSDRQWGKLGASLRPERRTAPVLPASADRPHPLVGRDLRMAAAMGRWDLRGDLREFRLAIAARPRGLRDLRLEAVGRRLVPDPRLPLSAIAARPALPLAAPLRVR